jgi:hypothetical protein
MDEVLAAAGLGDHRAGGPADLVAVGPGADRLEAGLLYFADPVVDPAFLGRLGDVNRTGSADPEPSLSPPKSSTTMSPSSIIRLVLNLPVWTLSTARHQQFRLGSLAGFMSVRRPLSEICILRHSRPVVIQQILELRDRGFVPPKAGDCGLSGFNVISTRGVRIAR